MKTRRILFAAMAAAMLLPSCEILDNNPESGEGVPCELTVNLSGLQTKGAATSEEEQVNDVQVFVFRGNDLDAYKFAMDKSVTLSCTSGGRTVYAVVNAPSLTDVTTKSALLAALSRLQDNGKTNLIMIGETPVTVPSAQAITVHVTRIASRVVLKKITRAFTSMALLHESFRVDKVYISNAAGDINYGLTSAPTIWYNQAQTSTDAPTLLSATLGVELYDPDSYSTPLTFYTYPNNAQTLTTRLVVQATLGTRTYYYPIDLPALQSNTSYEIPELVITRPGSDDPQVPVTSADVTFNIVVDDWDVSTMATERI